MMNTPGPSHRRSSRASTRSAVEEVAQLAVAGSDHAQATHRKLGPDAVAKETPVDEIRGVSASARLLDLQPPSTAGRTFSGRSTATGFASGASDVTHMVLREGEGEASTPRLQRAEAKRAAQNNLKRKLEKLAARHQTGTFLAPRRAKVAKIDTECEVEQGRDARDAAVFKTPPRSSFAVATDGDVARPRTVPNDGEAHECETRGGLGDAGAAAGDLETRATASPNLLDVRLAETADVLNAQCMAGVANAIGLLPGALAPEENDDGCSVASDTGAGEDLFDDRGDGREAAFGDDELLDESGSGRRTLRNLLVRHVNTGIASDAVSLVPPRFANGVGNLVGNATSSAAISAHDGAHKNASPTAVVASHAGETFCARAAIRKTIAAKERRAFDSPPRTGYGKSALFRGRSGGNLKNLVASERRASASPSGSEGFAFIGAA
jgi:hypothetical protein